MEKKVTKPKAEAKPKSAANTAKKTVYKFELPELQTFLKAGVQFGHQVKKWNPKMKDYIYDRRDKIHIIDLSKTLPMLEEAMQFLAQAASEGEILFAGTKRQASEIVKEAAIESGANYIVNRWPGGLLTNFTLIQRSLKKMIELEDEFEKGVEDRTKFEVSQMKKDWVKMNRLYEGVKQMKEYPKAVVIVDAKYERGAIKEARRLRIPIVSLVDTNSNPSIIDYPIPANDDAINSIKLVIGLLAEAVKKGNGGKGVQHKLKDYSVFEVKLIKSEVKNDDAVEVASGESEAPKARIAKVEPKATKATKNAKGMLEDIQEKKETTKVAKAKKTRGKK
ncbi:30S ribosomal protein S2 [Candidatus Dojkabacteria bacterium]|uniref:Small ribosomal subunit protein uS2 n=1 Tax=Candidatus Dojkabacteria bacterium TaxID=2099670 RepID=A0A955L5N7_9BACT|nr:30S ribosomal protein S2 [Candidatus Dojkabacteria bacterium]